MDNVVLEQFGGSSRYRDRVAASRRRARVVARRRAALVLPVLAAALIFFGRGSAHVNGRRVRVGFTHATVAACARTAGLAVAPGDLLDVHGQVLTRAGGAPAYAWKNGVEVALTDRVGRGDDLRIAPAGDLTEPILTQIRYTDAPLQLPGGQEVPRSSSRAYVRGLRRDRVGATSGQVLSSELAYASAVVRRAQVVDRARCLALTFDDGPNDRYTPHYQDVLTQYGARATFFCLGECIVGHKPVFRRHLELGFEVGCHTWSHPHLPRLSAAAARDNISRCVQLMRAEGAEVRFFRPPYGEHNKTVDQIVASLGMKMALWDVDTSDYSRPGADVIFKRVMAGARGGAVVLMHDGGGPRSQTLAALTRLVPALQQKGFQLVTLSELRGLAPGFTGEIVFTLGGRQYRAKPLGRAVRVEVADKPVALPVGLLKVGDEILAPPRPIAALLGARVVYDKPTETVTITGPGGVAVLRLDSPLCELDGKPARLLSPPLLYETHVLVPVWVLARVCAVSCDYDQAAGVLRFGAGAQAWVPTASLW